MRRFRGPCSAALILVALLSVPAGRLAAEEPVELGEGVARTDALHDGQRAWHGWITVPDDARGLCVVLASKRDLDLFLRHARPLDGDLGEQADAASRGDGPLEVLRLTPDGDVKLEPGVWNVAVERAGHSDGAASFEIVAFVEQEGAPPLLLPGEEGVRSVSVDGAGPELRAWLPALATSLDFEIDAAEETDLQFELSGPGVYRRAGSVPRRILLDRQESPPGLYVLDLRAGGEGARAPQVRIRARWQYAVRTAAIRGEEPRPILRPGSSVTLTLGGAEFPTARNVRIPIRDGTGGFVIEATNRVRADVDLYVRRGRPLDKGDDDADYFALSSAPSERLIVGGSRALRRGIYHCEIVLVAGEGPVRVTMRVRTFALSAGRGTWGEQLPPPLPLRTWTKGRVEAGLAGVRWYEVTVPPRTRSLHAVLLDADAPLDLVLARRTDGSIMRRAMTARVNERIDHVFSTPPDTPRFFLLGVMNRNPYEEVVDYRIALSYDRPPSLPADFRWPPLLATDGREASLRVAAATVELTVRDNAGGSGTCVTPRGRILTCRHVLTVDEAGDEIQKEGVLVAFPARLDTPPVQSFVARVTHEDPERDLAMLVVTADIFGRPLPRDLALPWVPLGDSGRLQLGDPVTVFGYPSEGSERSRTPVILTRGTVSGLESIRGRPRWIKTDAWIGLGHSGGSMVDASLRLVGIPAATLGHGEVLGLAVPVSLVPAGWRAVIGRGVPR